MSCEPDRPTHAVHKAVAKPSTKAPSTVEVSEETVQYEYKRQIAWQFPWILKNLACLLINKVRFLLVGNKFVFHANSST